MATPPASGDSSHSCWLRLARELLCRGAMRAALVLVVIGVLATSAAAADPYRKLVPRSAPQKTRLDTIVAERKVEWNATKRRLGQVVRDRTLRRALRVTDGEIHLGGKPGHSVFLREDGLWHGVGGLFAKRATLSSWSLRTVILDISNTVGVTPESIDRAIEAWIGERAP